MKKVRLSYLRWAVLVLLFCFVLFASISSEIGEWYALSVYPWVSKFLSAISSVLPFSFDEWIVLAFVFLLLAYPFYAWRFQRKGWKLVLAGELEICLWIYVWFYWGWGMNYYRADFYQRAGVKPVVYDEVRFHDFLELFTEGLNSSFEECKKEGWMESPDLFLPVVEGRENSGTGNELLDLRTEIKQIYQCVPARFGLCRPLSFQQPKFSSFNSLYSNVGVLGFMGPFFAESHLNHELCMLEYPFTYAHELAHLLGVSSEAEANFWAYLVCIQSKQAFVRLCGYFGLLSYVRSNAFYLLSPAEFEKWENTLSADLLADFHRVHGYWAMRYNPWLGNLQSALYSFYLKRNKISSGQKNYAQVVGMLLALPNFKLIWTEPTSES